MLLILLVGQLSNTGAVHAQTSPSRAAITWGWNAMTKVNLVNNPPVAEDLRVEVGVNTPAHINLGWSTTDADNDPLTYTIITGPANGTLSGQAPEITYTPNSNYVGQDSFSFKANDGATDSNVATVLIRMVTCCHHPLALDDAYSTDENTPLNIAAPGVLSNDTDVDGNWLYAFLVTGPAHGTLNLKREGAFDFTPEANFSGPDSFTYRTCDGEQCSNVTTVSITVRQTSAVYDFSGFLQPVDNPGPGPSYVFNRVKAGSAVPVKFSLAGDQGLSIFSSGYPTSRPASCTIAGTSDSIEQTVTAGNSSLSYDAASDTYVYAWKTDKQWAGTCRVLNVLLDDGTQHLAYFQFK